MQDEERGRKIASDLGIISREEEIRSIDNQIWELQQRKSMLEKEIINSAGSFSEKFYAWLHSDQGDENDWHPDASDFPAINRYLDNKELNRHQVYDLTEMLAEYFDAAFGPDYTETERTEFFNPIENLGKYQRQKLTLEEVTKIAEEMLEKNIKGFTHDW